MILISQSACAEPRPASCEMQCPNAEHGGCILAHNHEGCCQVQSEEALCASCGLGSVPVQESWDTICAILHVLEQSEGSAAGRCICLHALLLMIFGHLSSGYGQHTGLLISDPAKDDLLVAATGSCQHSRKSMQECQTRLQKNIVNDTTKLLQRRGLMVASQGRQRW